jgi:ribosomal-protein-serine acetyltransferase
MFGCAIDPEISLQLLQLHHTETVFAAVDQNRQHLRAWLPWVDENHSSEDTRKFIQSSLHRFAEVGGFACGIWFNDRFVGCIDLLRINKTSHSAEIGYWLSIDHQGQGIMTRSCRRVIMYAFEDLKLHRLVIRAALENHRSRAIPEQLGFTQEGIQRQVFWLHDRYLDLVNYSLLNDEWQVRKSLS